MQLCLVQRTVLFAIVGGVEVIAAIAILPAIINSFLFLSSVKKIVEHREIKNPTSHTDDFKLKSTDDNHAPITLVRLLIAKKPLSEKQICNEVLKISYILWNFGYYYCIYDWCENLMAIKIYSFIFTMWILILIGGGLMVTIIGPFSLGSIGDINPIILSGIKVGIALVLIFVWVLTLTKVKNWIFKTDVKP